MVELEFGQYLLDMMLDMGPVNSAGFGIEARPDGAIRDYAAGCGIDLEPWEFRALRRMCRGFMAGLKSGKHPLGKPPMERGEG